MLGSLPNIASAKGMVRVPNLIGLTKTQAQAAILGSGLKILNELTTSTYDLVLNEQTLSQNPSQNTLVDYETGVSFNYYSYIPYTPTPTTSPTSTGGGGGTTNYAYFAYCSGTNMVTSGVSVISSGEDVTSTCLTLKSQNGNPAGWVCGSASNPSPSINCVTYTPTPSTTSSTTPSPTPSTTTTGTCPSSPLGQGLFEGLCWACGFYWAGQCLPSAPTTTTTSCVPTNGATRLNYTCPSLLEYYNDCTGVSLGCIPQTPTTPTTTTTTTTTSTCPSSPSGLTEGECWACGYYWAGQCLTSAPPSTTTTSVACTPVAGATRFKDGCASSLEYYDTCTGSSQGCVPSTFSFSPFGFVVPYSNFSFTPFGFTPTAFGFVVPYSNFSFSPFGFTPYFSTFGFVTG